MRLINILILVGAVMLLAGCRASAPGNRAQHAENEEIPARISNPTAAGHTELLHVIAEMLNGSKVTIADDALTADSILIIQPKHSTGRDLGRPESFRLVLNESRCVLIHEGSQMRVPLARSECTPMDAAMK